MNSLTDLLNQSTVKLTTPFGDQGTGFFVSPGLIITCAHVIAYGGDIPKNDNLKAHWIYKDITFNAKIFGDWYSIKKDIAILEFEKLKLDHPCVFLDDEILLNDKLYSFGYPDKDFNNGCPVTFEFEGKTGDSPPLIKFKLGKIRPGMSGSPILNQRTGKVCGMVTFTLDRTNITGGGGVSTDVIFSHFKELKNLNLVYHNENSQWIENINLQSIDVNQGVNIFSTLISGQNIFKEIKNVFNLSSEEKTNIINRQFIIDRIWKHWIEGLLEKSFYCNAIKLRFNVQINTIHPWESQVQEVKSNKHVLLSDIKYRNTAKITLKKIPYINKYF